MKVFNVKIGDKTVIKDMDPFESAGAKLLPADHFMNVQVKNGKLTIDGTPVKGGVKNGQLQI